MVIRALIILPWLMPPVVVGLIWLWLLDPNIGIVNVTLKALGLPMIAFLGLPQWAMPSIAMINIWEYVGYTALLIFAGLQSIPGSVYEAAHRRRLGVADLLEGDGAAAAPSAGLCRRDLGHRLFPNFRHDCHHDEGRAGERH
jgi:ABC-type spermidine/putrescine transport system permease subunit I